MEAKRKQGPIVLFLFNTWKLHKTGCPLSSRLNPNSELSLCVSFKSSLCFCSKCVEVISFLMFPKAFWVSVICCLFCTFNKQAWPKPVLQSLNVGTVNTISVLLCVFSGTFLWKWNLMVGKRKKKKKEERKRRNQSLLIHAIWMPGRCKGTYY